MTATSWPSPRENRQAAGRFNSASLAGVAAGSLPGMTREALHGPRCSIGCPGPGVPLGGATPGSTAGGLIASAGGQAHAVAAAKAVTVAVRQAHPVWGPNRI